MEAYLRVLEPLLENTQLNSRPYKKNEIYRVLQQLIHPGMRRKVHSTTKRLVKRIIENWWEKLMDCNSPYTSSLGPSTPSDDIPETELTKQIV